MRQIKSLYPFYRKGDLNPRELDNLTSFSHQAEAEISSHGQKSREILTLLTNL